MYVGVNCPHAAKDVYIENSSSDKKKIKTLSQALTGAAKSNNSNRTRLFVRNVMQLHKPAEQNEP